MISYDFFCFFRISLQDLVGLVLGTVCVCECVLGDGTDQVPVRITKGSRQARQGTGKILFLEDIKGPTFCFSAFDRQERSH